ncbi:sugar ABC transporter ATP-binding protein [Actibacterium mucosum KCTC 23349]|uniref:Sugar ABC transporter ATP-binding protein n=1 Tax=Actibacterium mucosum KCTC 23349 TaxID=1454373 RepID=A0A037ZGH6_9RHOB|nr:sn-glycerol-3-phosphate ABC transporter ATP-binding protein UgpC [Actibacterium mucosum]KAJ54641.1 sugar ABC transporter ATP-binding protein [Actibacterium mucosum KCTC 23349]
MATVEITNIEKYYGGYHALNDINVDIADGEFVVLVGPSGCGKSTLLQMIAGLETITGGELRIGGDVVNYLPPKQRDIAMVFQNYALYPHMTVGQNMGFSLRIRRDPADEIKAKVERAAKILNLDQLLDRFPRELSGGQRQRVAMGRAIVREPQVFLFDEPLSNLDAKLRLSMRTEIKELHQRLKTTTIYVTHDQDEAMTMADRIVVMNTGVVSQIGAPLDLYDRPANTFVAGFIGSPAMNFMDGTIQGGKFQAANGSSWALPSDAKVTEGQRCTFGVRPEFVEAGGDVAAKVIVTEPTGSETQIVADMGGEHFTCLFNERIAAQPGDTLKIGADPEKCHVFDIETGLRL